MPARMSGQAGSSILSKYFSLVLVDGVSVSPAGDYGEHFDGEERRLRAWLAPRALALRPLVEQLVAQGMPLASQLELRAEGGPETGAVGVELPAPEAPGFESTVTLVVLPQQPLSDAHLGALKQALQSALSARRGPPSGAVKRAELERRQEAPFHLTLSAVVSAFDAADEPELRQRFDAAWRSLHAALSAAPAKFQLIANGPHVRSGIDGHSFVDLRRGWLSAFVIVKTDDYQRTRRRLEDALDAALALGR